MSKFKQMFKDAEWQRKWEVQIAEYVELARHGDPSGAICSFCGKENDWADDIGFFYLSREDIKAPTAPACKSCYDGFPGKRHRKRYGVGER